VANERLYTTRRLAIVNSIVEKFKNEINGTGNYSVDVAGNVFPRLKFWDEIEEFPTICVNASKEARIYQGGGFKERYLSVKITCYVQAEDPTEALEILLEDVETCLEENSSLLYTTRSGQTAYTTMITIQSIDTDEGVMAPTGIGEILCEVRY
jgi:hypothetical protein